MFERWDIWWAWFNYEDQEGGKRRPVLILSPTEVYVLSAEITSHESRNMWGEYEIIKWSSANLPRPSTVRLSRIEKLKPEDFDQKIGRLQPADIVLLEEKLKMFYSEEDLK